MAGAMRMHMADRKTSLEETTAMSMQISPCLVRHSPPPFPLQQALPARV
jgi:hypothetical protein